VYEEEVFASDFVLWWSPDSAKVAFLALDETTVDEFTFPIYNPTENSYEVVPYTKDVSMKYPKPGYDNPLVSVHVFDLQKYLSTDQALGVPASQVTLELDWENRHPVTDSIIQEVAWVGNESLILKEVNRNADSGSVVLFDLSEETDLVRSRGKIVRKLGKDGEEGDEGWIDVTQGIYRLPSGLLPGGETAYLDIVPSKDGYKHIALFSPATSSTPHFVTSGQWEVTGGIQAVDIKHGLMYVSVLFFPVP
jgi:dipeptidyl aminopeptidase